MRTIWLSLWGGNNDVLFQFGSVRQGLPLANAQMNMATAADDMIAQVDRVLAAGATNVVVVTVPDIGANTPLGAGAGAQGSAILTGLTNTFNSRLRDAVGGRVTLVESDSVLSDVLADPARYGFTPNGGGFTQLAAVACNPNAEARNCIQGGANSNPATASLSLIFADPVHPTEQAHLVLGQAAAGALVAIGQAGVMPVATISALRQQSIGLEQRLNLGAFFINDEDGNRIRRPVGNVEVYGGAELGFYESDQQQVVPGFDAQTQVIKAAADVMVTPNIMVGVGGSVDHGQVDFNDGRGGFDSRLFVGALFGVAQIREGVYVNAALGGGLIDVYDIERNFSAGPARESYEGDTDGTYFIARSNLGAVLPVGNGFFLNPSVGFAYERVDLDGYSERAVGASSSALAAQVGDLEYEGHRGTIALAGFYRPPAAPTWTFGLRGSWEHDFNDDEVEVPFAVGGAPSNVQVAPRPDDSYGLLSATVSKELGHASTLNLQGSTVVGQDGVSGYTASLVYKHTF